ncbi:hypothetical protein XELAEV_18030476mg [Xenopus laevis]|uniref:Uncharacterized protein n=1 Tax=Xenopus laevis TaxID=8355 RepID=A0A974CLK1_XENLA|nr:hypothetical protein XELAEV_18030476mg [Xenopus laevis]
MSLRWNRTFKNLLYHLPTKNRCALVSPNLSYSWLISQAGLEARQACREQELKADLSPRHKKLYNERLLQDFPLSLVLSKKGEKGTYFIVATRSGLRIKIGPGISVFYYWEFQQANNPIMHCETFTDIWAAAIRSQYQECGML